MIAGRFRDRNGKEINRSGNAGMNGMAERDVDVAEVVYNAPEFFLAIIHIIKLCPYRCVIVVIVDSLNTLFFFRDKYRDHLQTLI